MLVPTQRLEHCKVVDPFHLASLNVGSWVIQAHTHFLQSVNLLGFDILGLVDDRVEVLEPIH
jgi:hypothetical protein